MDRVFLAGQFREINKGEFWELIIGGSREIKEKAWRRLKRLTRGGVWGKIGRDWAVAKW